MGSPVFWVLWAPKLGDVRSTALSDPAEPSALPQGQGPVFTPPGI